MFEGFSLGVGPDDGEEFPRLTDEEFAEIQAEPLPPEFAHLKPLGSDPDAFVVQAAEAGPTPHSLPLLTAVPYHQLSSTARSLALQQLDRLSSTVEAEKAMVTAVIAGPEPTTREAKLDDYAAQEVAAATRCSVYAADTKIAFARDLASRFKATQLAMRTGGITYCQARAMTDAFRHLPDDLRRELEANMLKYSHRQSQQNFRRSLTRWLAKKDPSWTARAKMERAEVVVHHQANDDGTGELFFKGPLEITSLVDLALAVTAHQMKPEAGGTVAERKLAALRDWADAALDSPGAPTQHGLAVRLNIHVHASTILGKDDQLAEIPGVGMIPADAARWTLADGADVRLLLTEKRTGRITAIDPTVYQVPPALADLLISQYVTSAAPYSNVPAAGCDLEHNIPHPQGPTDEQNMTPVCRRWHRAKTHGGWSYAKDPATGIVTWRSPTGLKVEIDPYDYRAGP